MEHERIELNINDDLETYKTEIWKGLSFEEVKKVCAVLISTSLIFSFLHFICYLPGVICLWTTMLLVMPMALLLFMRVQGLALKDYVRRAWAMRFDEPLYFASDEAELPAPAAKASRKQKKTIRRQELQEWKAHKKALKQKKKEEKKRNKEWRGNTHGTIS